jgi:AcrR family transcriptional regulator
VKTVHRHNHRTILRTAERLFVSRGFDQVTLDEVSRKARVGKGTIYLYFANKEDLYAQVILCGLDEICEVVGQHAAGGLTPDEKLFATAKALRRFYRKRRGLVRVLFTEEFRRKLRCRSLHDDLHDRQGRLLRQVGSIISEGARSGSFRSDVPPMVTARVFLASLRESARTNHGRSQVVSLNRLLGVFLDGIRKR